LLRVVTTGQNSGHLERQLHQLLTTVCCTFKICCAYTPTDKVFLILYKELYYRHVYSIPGTPPTLKQRIEWVNLLLILFNFVVNWNPSRSWQNYCDLFEYWSKIPFVKMLAKFAKLPHRSCYRSSATSPVVVGYHWRVHLPIPILLPESFKVEK